MTFDPAHPTLLSALAVLEGEIECNDPRHVEIAWRYVQWCREVWRVPVYIDKGDLPLTGPLREAA